MVPPMLSSLRLRNFKAWKDSGEVRLAPLTVLFGSNSAGKTSIPQLLLLLKQTAESPGRQRALMLGDGRSLVDVGSFEEVSHGHDVGHPVSFSLGWSLPETLTVHDAIGAKTFAGDTLGFSASIAADRHLQPKVTALSYTLGHNGEPVLDLSYQREEHGFSLTSERYALSRHEGKSGVLPEPLRFYGFPSEVAAHYQNASFSSDLVLALEQMLRQVQYVGPLRQPPRRLYLWSGELPEHVGSEGEHTIEALLASQDRAFAWREGEPEKPLQELVAERLKAMGLIQDFRVQQIGPHRREYEVLVRTSPKLPEVKLTDVGFGVSQVLPILVEALFVPRRSIVIVEQPEVHLHPRVQAELADLFVDAIRAREGGEVREVQFIVESHSEHFLRRLQRRIAEEHLSHEDAALYFVHTEDAEARLEPLDVDRFGNIRNWPEDFFGDEMADLVARSEAQARRSRGGAK